MAKQGNGSSKKTAGKQSASKKACGGFTDTKRVKDLVALMVENGLTEIELVEDKSKITLRRGATGGGGVSGAGGSYALAAPAVGGGGGHAMMAPVAASPVAAVAAAAEEVLVPVKSPMVGTFYTAANPESDAYVSVGTPVGEDTVVCIIEAMKVFNEIRAETSGTIVKILAQNGQAVEFGQPLFMVRPN